MQKLDTATDEQFVPLDCVICGFLFRDFQDCMQYLETKCCVACWISFLEPLRKLNKNEEYEPNPEEIKTWREKVSSCE
jgi:hypothetical protein